MTTLNNKWLKLEFEVTEAIQRLSLEILRQSILVGH